MNFPYDKLPEMWQLVGAGLFAIGLLWTLWGAPWSRFMQPAFSHVFLGSCVGLLVMWAIKASGVPGLDYHFVGATLVTLMFGWRLAVLSLSVVLVANAIDGSIPWTSVPMVGLLLVMLPVGVSYLIYRWVDRTLPNHFFVFIFLNAFFGAAVALGLSLLAAVGVMMLSGQPELSSMGTEYARFLPLMLFPESFITGALITMMVVFRPTWVVSFDDERYLKGR